MTFFLLLYLWPWRWELMNDWMAPERLDTAVTRVAKPCRWTSFRFSSIWIRLCSSSIISRCLFSFFSSQLLRALASTDALRIMLEPMFLTFLRFDDSDPLFSSWSLCSDPDDSVFSTIKQSSNIESHKCSC